MPRNLSGLYSLPAGSTIANGDLSDASDLNTPLADIEADLNVARPISTGGTGATTAADALVNLGLTATAAEINVLDGITATVTELNYVDGVTSAIQTQLNAKQASDATLTSLSGLAFVAGDTVYATAADTLARLPIGTAAQVLTVNAGATAPEWKTINPGYTWLAAQATTSGTSVIFTGIPSTATEVVVVLDQVSMSGTNDLVVVARVAGAGVTSGYVSNAVDTTGGNVSLTAGMAVYANSDPASLIGSMFWHKIPGSNTWVQSHSISVSGTKTSVGGGRIALAGALDGIAVAPTGANTFDAGQITVGYR